MKFIDVSGVLLKDGGVLAIVHRYISHHFISSTNFSVCCQCLTVCFHPSSKYNIRVPFGSIIVRTYTIYVLRVVVVLKWLTQLPNYRRAVGVGRRTDRAYFVPVASSVHRETVMDR